MVIPALCLTYHCEYWLSNSTLTKVYFTWFKGTQIYITPNIIHKSHKFLKPLQSKNIDIRQNSDILTTVDLCNSIKKCGGYRPYWQNAEYFTTK